MVNNNSLTLKKKNILIRLLQGDIPLVTIFWSTFWIGLALDIVLIAWEAFSPMENPIEIISYLVYCIFCFIFNVITSISIWNSATKYKEVWIFI